MCSYMSSIKNQERHSTLFNSRIPSYSRRLHGLETRSQGPLRHSRPSRSLLFHFCHTAPLTASERVNSFSRLHGLETRSVRQQCGSVVRYRSKSSDLASLSSGHYGPSISAGLARAGQSHSDGEQTLLFVC